MASDGSRWSFISQLAIALGVAGALFLFAGWLAVRIAVGGPRDEVPDLSGLSEQEAIQRLSELGMEAEIDEIRLPREDLPAETVARQIPGAGTPVKRMRVVRLMLASGPRQRFTPRMVGESRNRALIALEQQDFEVDYVATAPSWEVPRDRIIAQEPNPAELTVGENTPLRLLTSLGAPTRFYVMVDLVGRPVREVRARLESLGFRVTEGVNRRVVENVPPGTVVEQQPYAGFRIAEGGQIQLRVSR